MELSMPTPNNRCSQIGLKQCWRRHKTCIQPTEQTVEKWDCSFQGFIVETACWASVRGG